MTNKHVVFQIEKCKNTTEYNECTSSENIDEFMKDAYVEGWVIEESMDM